MAYGEGTITAGPGWMGSGTSRYDIDARADIRADLRSMEAPMLQALLEDRFQLKIRRVTRESPMYALTVATSGARLKPSSERSCNYYWPRNGLLVQPMPGRCVVFAGATGLPPYIRLEGQAIGLEEFCRLLAGPLGRPVIDKTGINGTFDFHLNFAGDETPSSLARLYPPLPSVVEEQLGLKLVPFTGPREFLVVDQVEKPSGN